MKTIIAKTESGYLIEALAKTHPVDCPWKSMETCKACIEKPCQNKKKG